jgi:hypothetical protein
MGVSSPFPHALGDTGNPADPDPDSGSEPRPERRANYFVFGYPSDVFESPAEPKETQPAPLPFPQQVSIMPDEEMKRDFQLLSTKISIVAVRTATIEDYPGSFV